MNLLKLDKEVIKTIESVGDPMTSLIITERGLRPLIKMASKEQEKFINKHFFPK